VNILDDWNEFHTIEFWNENKQTWEIFQTHDPKHVGISSLALTFAEIVVNDREDLQWRLTTCKYKVYDL
jgi:hypothetical protein